MSKFTLVRADDWQGLYVDGKLVVEEHKISLEDLAHFLGADFSGFYLDDKQETKLMDEGSLPMLLEELEEWKNYEPDALTEAD